MNLLFICYANMSRSQIAEGFARKNYSFYRVASAGIKAYQEGRGPSSRAVAVMNEIGIDISNQTCNQLIPKMLEDIDKAIVLCSKLDCPDYLKNSEKIIYWTIEDPKVGDVGVYRKTRNQINDLILNRL